MTSSAGFSVERLTVMPKIAKRRRAAVESVYENIYEKVYGVKPPKNSKARKMIRAGYDDVFSYNAAVRRGEI